MFRSSEPATSMSQVSARGWAGRAPERPSAGGGAGGTLARSDWRAWGRAGPHVRPRGVAPPSRSRGRQFPPLCGAVEAAPTTACDHAAQAHRRPDQRLVHHRQDRDRCGAAGLAARLPGRGGQGRGAAQGRHPRAHPSAEAGPSPGPSPGPGVADGTREVRGQGRPGGTPARRGLGPHWHVSGPRRAGRLQGAACQTSPIPSPTPG